MTEKVVVVTGASMGIGEAIAARFLREQHSVVLSSRDLGRSEAARQRLGNTARTLAVACDVTVQQQIVALLAAALERFGRIDVWVNNAGFGLVDSVEQMDMAACRRMFDTNLFGVIDCMQVVAPVFKQQRSGAFVNISSMAGFISVPYMSAYGATKHALNCIGRAVWSAWRQDRREVVVPWTGHLVIAFARLFPNIFNWGMLRSLRRMDSGKSARSA